MSIPWTEAERSILRDGLAEGKSAGKIAESLPGRSRNAVIGEAHRRQIKMNGNGNAGNKSPRSHIARQKPSAPRALAPPPPVVRMAVQRPAPPSEPPVVPGGPIPLLDRKDDQCCWPADQKRFVCGAPRETPLPGKRPSPYCDYHAALARGVQPKE